MPFTAKDSGGSTMDWEPHPPGLFQAVCYAVIDLGTHYNEMYNNEQHKCWIAWETTEKIELEIEGEQTLKPRSIAEFYTVSLSEKANLRAMLEGWRGKGFTTYELEGFDISKLVGVNCQVQIIWKKKKDGVTDKAVVKSVLPARGLKEIKPENKTCYFSFEDHGTELIESIPDGIKSIIMKSREWNETGQQNHDPLTDSNPWGDNAPPPNDEDDIPF